MILLSVLKEVLRLSIHSPWFTKEDPGCLGKDFAQECKTKVVSQINQPTTPEFS